MCGCMNPLRCCAPRRPFSEQKGEDVAVRTRGILRCRFAPRKGRLAFVHLVHPHPSPLPLRERGLSLVNQGFVGAGGHVVGI